MALNRNFRTTYYKTLGVPVVQHIVDVEASYAALLAEQVVNRAQVVKLAQEIGIPAHYRDVVWQLLCGVLPPHPSIWEFALHERTLMYHDVLEAARVLPPVALTASSAHADIDASIAASAAGEVANDSSETPSTSHKQSSVSTTDRARLIALHRTYWIEIMVREPLRGMDDTVYLDCVARSVCDVLTGAMERFWCFVKLLELFHDGMRQFKPTVTLQHFYDVMTLADFETLFIRIVEALKKD